MEQSFCGLEQDQRRHEIGITSVGADAAGLCRCRPAIAGDADVRVTLIEVGGVRLGRITSVGADAAGLRRCRPAIAGDADVRVTLIEVGGVRLGLTTDYDMAEK